MLIDAKFGVKVPEVCSRFTYKKAFPPRDVVKKETQRPCTTIAHLYAHQFRNCFELLPKFHPIEVEAMIAASPVKATDERGVFLQTKPFSQMRVLTARPDRLK